jgi:16S rRNA A1518/A1519 N6-dimethyltransferase RsmA/KsgA/DIM1 with predicted DNA glycosylase/AP lyase activity
VILCAAQEEVAQRFAKQTPGSRDYRYMSVFCRYFSRWVPAARFVGALVVRGVKHEL